MPRLRGNTGLFVHFHEGLARYRAVLSLPGAAAFFAAAAVARLGVAMTILGVLWAVRGATGSFASAGVTTAVFALADATAGPQVARLVEDRGQRRILPWSVAVFVVRRLGADRRRRPAPAARGARPDGDDGGRQRPAGGIILGGSVAAHRPHAGPGRGGTVAGSRAQRRDPPVRPGSRQRAERRAVPGRRD